MITSDKGSWKQAHESPSSWNVRPGAAGCVSGSTVAGAVRTSPPACGEDTLQEGRKMLFESAASAESY